MTMDVEEQKVKFVVAATRRERSLTALCQEFGISRPTGCLWRKRYQEAGLAGSRNAAGVHGESGAHQHRVGAACGGDAAALSRLGSAQAAGAAGTPTSGT